MSDLGERLARSTATLIDIASPSREEQAIADYVEGQLRALDNLEVVRIEDNVIARTTLERGTRLVLGGHLDTVPPAGNERSERKGEKLYGCGASDMKGGLAVMLELAANLDQPPIDVTFIFYACEEIARRYSGLHAIERERPELLAADAAVLLEPTSARIEAGCQGVVRAVIELGGVRAHSARPWAGVNAIHRLHELLVKVASYEAREPVIDGCRYHESLQAVRVEGGGAGNVVPDLARVVLSHRFAPDRDAEQAFGALGEFLAPVLDAALGDRIELEESSPAAPPSLSQPLLGELVRTSGEAPVAKVAWTDVAYFYERNVPAANFGPGDPMLAHRSDEYLEVDALERTHRALANLVAHAGALTGAPTAVEGR